MKTKILGLFVLVALLLSACAGAELIDEAPAPEEVEVVEEESMEEAEEAVEAKSLKLGLILAHSVVSRWQFDEQGFKDETAALGDEAIVVSSEDSAETQANQVDNMITQGVNALVITPVDAATAATLFEKAEEAGIPTVNYNFIVPDISPSYIIFRDAREFGQITAREALKEHPTGNYVLVSGDAANSVAVDTTAGYMDVLQPEIDAGNIKVVSQKYNTGWSPQSAQTQVEEALVATNNDIAAVLSNNDGMAIGAMQVLEQEGLLGEVFVSGVDADLPNIQAIAQGKQDITIWTNFYQMGQYAARAAHAAATNTTPDVDRLEPRNNGTAEDVPTVIMETVVVNQDNLCEWIKEWGWVTYEDAYKFVENPPDC